LIDWVSTPPASSPIEPPAEATKLKTPIALACSRGSETPGEQQQAAEGDQIGVDDPGKARLRETEVVLDRG
jgi:hypothetical protein